MDGGFRKKDSRHFYLWELNFDYFCFMTVGNKLTSIEVSEAENGCLVRCTYKKERTGKQTYDDYETKTYVAGQDLMDKILAEVGEEVDEAPKPKKTVKSAFKN